MIFFKSLYIVVTVLFLFSCSSKIESTAHGSRAISSDSSIEDLIEKKLDELFETDDEIQRDILCSEILVLCEEVDSTSCIIAEALCEKTQTGDDGSTDDGSTDDGSTDDGNEGQNGGDDSHSGGNDSPVGSSGSCSSQHLFERNKWPLIKYDNKSIFKNVLSINSLNFSNYYGKSIAPAPYSYPDNFSKTLAFHKQAGESLEQLNISDFSFDFPSLLQLKFTTKNPDPVTTLYMQIIVRYGVTNYFEQAGFAKPALKINDNLLADQPAANGNYIVKLTAKYSTINCVLGEDCEAQLISSSLLEKLPYSPSASPKAYNTGNVVNNFDWNISKANNKTHYCIGNPCSWNKSGKYFENSFLTFQKIEVSNSKCSWSENTSYHRFLDFSMDLPYKNQEDSYGYLLQNDGDFKINMNLNYKSL